MRTIVVVCREAILFGTAGARVERRFSTCITAHAVVESGITIRAAFTPGGEVDQASAVGNTRLGNVVLVDILSSHEEPQGEETKGDIHLHLEVYFQGAGLVCVRMRLRAGSIWRNSEMARGSFSAACVEPYNRSIRENMLCPFEFLILMQ